MRILHYSDSFGGETTTFIYNDAKHLSRNYEFKYICTRLEKSENTPDIDVEKIPFTRNIISRKFYWWLWKLDFYLSFRNKSFARELKNSVDQFNPDIIHLQFGYEALRFLDNYYVEGLPIVVQFRGYDASQMLRKKTYIKRIRSYLSRRNVFPAYVSNSIKKNLERVGVNMNGGLLLRSGIPTDFFKRNSRKRKSEHFIFLQVSSLSRKKGHIYTIRAFAKFLNEFADNKNKYKLIFTGDGSRAQSLKNRCEELDIAKNVEFVGVISTQEVKELMEDADVFVHHSITAANGDKEGIPNSLMEAMAMELPVLSTYHSGIPELVEDGINGYLVDEKDIDAYAQRMSDIISWPLQEQNRKVIENNYSSSKHYKTLENYYQKLIKEYNDIS